MLNALLEKRKQVFEDSVRRVAGAIIHEQITRKQLARTFGIDETLFTPDMEAYFETFLRLVVGKNTRDFLKRKHKHKVPEGQEGSVILDMNFFSTNSEYGFQFNSTLLHDSLHALVGLARSKNKRHMKSLTPAYEQKKPYAEEILTAIVHFPTPQIALQVRDEVLVSEFQDGLSLGANGAAPGLNSSGPAAAKKYMIDRIKDFYNDVDGPWADLVAHVTAASAKVDPVFHRIMTEIAENNGRDPFVLYNIFVREAEEFLATFAPDVRKPVIPRAI